MKLRIGSRAKKILLLLFIVAVIVAFAFMIVPRDVAKEIQDKDVVSDKKRFTPSESVDIAMAMKLITHEPPKMLNPPDDMPPLLLYPPSDDELKRLTGE